MDSTDAVAKANKAKHTIQTLSATYRSTKQSQPVPKVHKVQWNHEQ